MRILYLFLWQGWILPEKCVKIVCAKIYFFAFASEFIFFYWCPIKISKGIKVSLNRSIYAVEIFFFKFQAPRFRKELIDVAKFHQNCHVLPVFLRIVKQAIEIHIIHQRYSDHCGQSRETPCTF